MPRVRVFHWKAAEATPLLATLQRAGFDTEYDEAAQQSLRALREAPPDAVLIDLSRLPSHGRECAVHLRGSRRTRQIPIVFVNGAPEKIEAVRSVLPDAPFVPSARVAAALKNAIRKGVPESAISIWSLTRNLHRLPTQKLGIREGMEVGLIAPPSDYVRALGPLPADVSFNEQGAGSEPLTLWFAYYAEDFFDLVPRAPALAAKTKLWVLWRKQSARSTGLTRKDILGAMAGLGLTFWKMCSVDSTWSAMAFSAPKRQKIFEIPRGPRG